MKEISAGGVVYRQGKDDLFFLMIVDRYGKVTLAKGKQEPGETIEETALREIAEETGIRGRLIEHLETVHYDYIHPASGEKVDKEVHYFLIEAYTSEITVQETEIQAVRWCTPQEAWQLQLQNGYKNNESVLRKALKLFGTEV
ncbi:NUDIX domain-containing protein [Brevibacillus sp. SYP-B805]|uniref:NUDIX hydrolase n=1 Tax=Brevibacillus sp. SYP-B805 TaxID=1578199 RepID=UPI0013EDF796|nr:NUDIX domain-containing protein [Brevibacillus sp. SYP-B805]NGQ94137.1 NUDIX domain-containing protein [Brevibacillus sp. SYP-B805]